MCVCVLLFEKMYCRSDGVYMFEKCAVDGPYKNEFINLCNEPLWTIRGRTRGTGTTYRAGHVADISIYRHIISIPSINIIDKYQVLCKYVFSYRRMHNNFVIRIPSLLLVEKYSKTVKL